MPNRRLRIGLALSVLTGLTLSVIGVGFVYGKLRARECSWTSQSIDAASDAALRSQDTIASILASNSMLRDASSDVVALQRGDDKSTDWSIWDEETGSCLAARFRLGADLGIADRLAVRYELWMFDSERDSRVAFKRLDPAYPQEEKRVVDWNPLSHRRRIETWHDGVTYCMSGSLSSCEQWAAWGFPLDCPFLVEVTLDRSGHHLSLESVSRLAESLLPALSDVSAVTCR